ncbi:hypothetical protein [Nocardioides sp.]|uniref:hypothetical protein n=1 Tax=Nocardioides sp. TaxID=35761 RepID=UPI00378388E4
MTARSRTRTLLFGAAAAALLAPLAIVAGFASPASAASGKPHEVYMYKVEKHVDLDGEYPDNLMHEHVSCNGGDIALDGMWRVDHVDQANPPETSGDERNVVITASYGDSGDRALWHFRANNYADGRAQIKLFVTCIRGTVEQAYGHSHSVQISQRYDDNRGLPVGVSTDWTHVNSCPDGSLAVAPGFNISDDLHRARLFRSWPTDDYRSWRWAFVVDDPGTNISVYLRCLTIKTGPGGAGGHVHNLLWAWRPNGSFLDHQFFDRVGVQERRINCDDGNNGAMYQDYKAMVGAFWSSNPFHHWFLGMDPRPKQRSYSFWWDGSGSNDIYLGALCIRARTGKQLAP